MARTPNTETGILLTEPTNLAGRYRCVYCLRRYELRSVCPNCGEHSTIVRMSSTATTQCAACGDSMLLPI